jgi:hypothetical protein
MQLLHNIDIMKRKVGKCMIKFMGFSKTSIFTFIAWAVLQSIRLQNGIDGNVYLKFPASQETYISRGLVAGTSSQTSSELRCTLYKSLSRYSLAKLKFLDKNARLKIMSIMLGVVLSPKCLKLLL